METSCNSLYGLGLATLRVLKSQRPHLRLIHKVKFLHQQAPRLRHPLLGLIPHNDISTAPLSFSTWSSKKSQSSARPLTTPPPSPQPEPSPASSVPAYELTVTCRPCTHRSAHRISQQGYHHGTVLVTCPECKNRHVISDHLKIFSDKRITIEDILEEKGEQLKKGTLGPEGDMEFWDDGTKTRREEPLLKDGESTPRY